MQDYESQLNRLLDVVERLEQKTTQIDYEIKAIKNYQEFLQRSMRRDSEKMIALYKVVEAEAKSERSAIALQLRQISNKVITQELINKYKAYSNIHPSQYPLALTAWYEETTGKKLNLSNPQTINEKIQWIKLYDNTSQKVKLADKYLAREYIADKLGEEYLIPLVGVWDRFDDIDFNSLPDKFVLKCNHGASFNVIVKDKHDINILDLKSKFDHWMNINFAFIMGFEMQYKDIPRRIIAEEYLENCDGDMPDYKVWCFNGKAQYIQYVVNRQKDAKEAFYDKEWNLMPFVCNNPKLDNEIKKPMNLEVILKSAEVLRHGFKLVRVDLYVLDDGTIKCGEMTFTPSSGIARWSPSEYDLVLGHRLNIL